MAFLEEQCAKHAIIGEDLFQVRLICEEMSTNICKYVSHEPIDEFEFKMKVEPNSCELTFIDAGLAFDPDSVDKPDTESAVEDREIGGLGIHLVKGFCERLAYKRENDRNIVRVVTHLHRRDRS